MAAGITRGMRGFWQTATGVSMGLAVTLIVSLFGLLSVSSDYAIYAMILAGIGLICGALFVWLLISDMWSGLRASQT
jgi:threonine/homoserine/homoserine lactone efflux protein